MGGGRDVDEDKRATLRRFAALGAASPLVSLAGGGDSDAREAIAGYLSTTPGAHFSQIRDDLQLGTGETQYHLRELAGRDAVESRKDGEYRRYYPAGQFDDFERVALGHLRRETTRGLVVELLADPTLSGSELATRLDVSPSTVSKHAGRLAEDGLLAREDGYELRRPATLLTLVVRYADSFGPAARSLADDADALVSYDP